MNAFIHNATQFTLGIAKNGLDQMALINLFENVSIQFLLKRNAVLYRLLQDDLYLLLELFITKLLLLINLGIGICRLLCLSCGVLVNNTVVFKLTSFVNYNAIIVLFF